MCFYVLISDSQLKHFMKMIHEFNEDETKSKKLYEIQFSEHVLNVFERPSNPKVYCIERKRIKSVSNQWLAEQVIKSSFGAKIVEFVPREN